VNVPPAAIASTETLAVENRPRGYDIAPWGFLRATLAVARSPRRGEYLLVHFGSGSFLRTDRLGALVARALVAGRRGAEAMRLVEDIEAGAGDRARLLICLLGATGAMTLEPPARLPRLFRKAASQAASAMLGVLATTASAAPLRFWAWVLRTWSRNPIPRHVWRSGSMTILTNLNRSGYADHDERWLDNVGRQIAAEPSRNYMINYLSLALPPGPLAKLIDRLFDSKSLDDLAIRLRSTGPVVAAFLHGPLVASVPNALRNRGVEVVRVVVPDTHGLNVSKDSDPLGNLFGDPLDAAVDESDRNASLDLLRHLKSGRHVHLALDRVTERPTIYRRADIEFLGQFMPRNDGPAWLAVSSGRPLMLWTTHNSPSGVVISASPLLYPDSSLPAAARVADLSRRLYVDAEAAIREHPEAWMGWRIAPSESDPSDDYNYSSFSSRYEEPELGRWLEFGPHAGELAPDFRLEDIAGTAVRLSDLRGRPVVLEFGSYTCGIFPDSVPDMERLSREHPEAAFMVIAVREAHPGTLAPAHTTMAEKQQAARRLAAAEGLRRRVLVDDLDGTVHREYGGAWNPVYVIDAKGRVVYRRAWNHPAEVANVLQMLANEGSPDPGESVELPHLHRRNPIGQVVLDRGGENALLDVYRTGSPYLRRALRESPSQAVRAVLRNVKQ